jgi:DNA-binding XRE family transcriptional regulator
MAKAPSQKKTHRNRGRLRTSKSPAVSALAFCVVKLRKARKWSQEELAAQAGITQDMVSLIENRRGSPSVETVEKIAEAFGLRIADLFDAPGAPPRKS